MAFKMKGFPFAGKSPIKDIQGDGTPEGTNHYHNNKHYDGMKHDKDGNWIEETKPAPKFKSALKQKEVNDAAVAGAVVGGGAMSNVEEKPKNTWDVDGDGQMNDKERVAYLKELGLTEQEMQDEMVELAKQYGDDDYDLQDWIDAAKSLSARKKTNK